MDSTNSLFIKKTKSSILPLFLWIHIQHSTFHHHSSVPVTADQSTMHTTQDDVKAVQKRTFCRRKKILNICNLSYIPTFAKANGPPFSPERETFRMLPLISFCILTFCKNRTFRFTPVICKDCTILSREWHNHSCGLMVCFKAE